MGGAFPGCQGATFYTFLDSRGIMVSVDLRTVKREREEKERWDWGMRGPLKQIVIVRMRLCGMQCLYFRSLGGSGRRCEEAVEVSFSGLETRHGEKLDTLVTHLSGRFSRKIRCESGGSFKGHQACRGTFMCLGRRRLVSTQEGVSIYFWSERKLSHALVHPFHLAHPHLLP